MTRFARAKGSKASNERLPDEATPWSVMKQQLDETSSMKNNEPTKVKSARELLREKDNPFYYDTTGNVNTDWAEFESPKTAHKESKVRAAPTNDNTPSDNNRKKNKKKEATGAEHRNGVAKSCDESSITKKKKSSEPKTETSTKEATAVTLVKNIPEERTEVSTEKAKKKKNKKKPRQNSPAAENKTNGESCAGTEESSGKNIKNAKKVESLGVEIKAPESESLDSEQKQPPTQIASLKVSKRHKRNQKRIEKNALKAAGNTIVGETQKSGGFDADGNDWSSSVNFGAKQKLDSEGKPIRDRRIDENVDNSKRSLPFNRSDGLNNARKRKAPKIRDDKEHKRKKPDSGSIKCTINGMNVEIVKFNGFPVKKEDAERLTELRKQMVMKGIPKSEIEGAMKLERRRAEKSLSRLRKQVCFHCRKAGHNLSDCPELGEEEAVTGICFKCGSTEHTHFECKVNKKEEFRFASCFICREQGHIAKQCPDNPKGMYPQGGSCKICGDVTHLRRDCPELKQENEETTMTLNTIAESTLEALDEDATNKKPADESKKTTGKIIKF